MRHQIFLNDKGFIEMINTGTMSPDDVEELGKKIVSMTTILEDERKKIKILVDSTLVKSWEDLTQPFVSIVFKNSRFKKIAIFGANEHILGLQQAVITQLGVQDRAKTFKTRAEAEAWLDEN